MTTSSAGPLPTASFRADCSRCSGLCCVAPSQLAVQGFPTDKAADIPCAQLDARNRCSIYATRRDRGYEPCEGFDCYGAGQWVTQELFAGATWADSADIAARMFAAYRHWLPRFEAAALLDAALPLVRDDARPAIAARIAELTDADRSLPATDRDRLRRETLTLIRSLLAAPLPDNFKS